MDKSFSTEAKVGIFVLAGLIILGYMSLKVGDLHIGKDKGYTVYVTFSNAGGLTNDAAVRVAGVRVGKVRSIRLLDQKARIEMLIDHNVFLEKDARASIKTAGVLGEKYIEITPGKSKQFLVDNTEIITTIAPADLDNLMNQITAIADDIKDVTKSLKESIGSQKSSDNINEILENVRDATKALKNITERNEEKIDQLFSNLESITYSIDDLIVQNDEKINNFFTNFEELSISLNQLVESNNNQISRAVANLEDFTEDLSSISSRNKEPIEEVVSNLKAFSENLSEKTPDIMAQLDVISKNLNLILDENRGNIKEGVRNINEASFKLKDTLDSISVVSKRVEDSEGTIGKLISEDTTYNKLNDTLTGINNYINKAEQFKTFVDFRSEYMDGPSEFKHYLNLKLQPNQDKFYFVEIIDDPAGSEVVTDKYVTNQSGDEPAETTYTHERIVRDKFKFSVGIAKRYYDLVIRGGIIESTGGLGLDYHLFDDRLKISFDAYDFNNDDNVHLKAALRINFLKHLFVTAGYDDFIKHDTDPSYFYGAGFSFLDDDLKYLLINAPVSP